MSAPTLLMGAVAYDPKVVTIWDGFKAYFAENGLDFDYVLYSNYGRQVHGHFQGQYHVAWNSPLAWLQAEAVAKAKGRSARAVAMRDTDRDLTSLLVVKADSGIESFADLKGKTVGVGAADSPQATLIPLLYLAEHGLEPGRDFEVRRFDELLGKHGDHIGGERLAAGALMDGSVDACAMIDGNHMAFVREGTLQESSSRILAQTEKYDHCNFTVLDDAPAELVDRFVALLLQMSYDDDRVRPLLDLEGLKQWQTGRVVGYAALERAVERFDTLGPFLSEFGIE